MNKGSSSTEHLFNLYGIHFLPSHKNYPMGQGSIVHMNGTVRIGVLCGMPYLWQLSFRWNGLRGASG